MLKRRATQASWARFSAAKGVFWLGLTAAIAPQTSGAQVGLPRWHLQPELRLGTIDGPSALAAIQHVTVSPTSRAIFISGVGEIKVFDEAGRYLRTFGRTGHGPGEFHGLRGLGWAGEALVVLRFNPGRALLFTEEGELISDRMVTAHPDGGLNMIGEPVGLMGPTHYLWTYRVGYESLIPGGLERIPMVRTNGDGDDVVLDHLDLANNGWRVGPVVGWHPLAGGSQYGSDPQGQFVVIVHQRPSTEAQSGAFRVRKLNAEGQVQYARTYRYTPRAVPAAYRDSIVGAWSDGLRRRGESASVISAAARVVRVPRFQPPVTEVKVATDGSVWLRREDVDVQEVTWVVLDASGDPVGHLLLPPSFRPRHIDSDSVWGSEVDDIGVPKAVRYRIVR